MTTEQAWFGGGTVNVSISPMRNVDGDPLWVLAISYSDAYGPDYLPSRLPIDEDFIQEFLGLMNARQEATYKRGYSDAKKEVVASLNKLEPEKAARGGR